MTWREANAARRREVLRRGVTLGAILAALVAGMYGFYLRESLIVRFTPTDITRVWLPAAMAEVRDLPSSSRPAAGIPVIVYHGIVTDPSSCNITPETFLEHMQALKSAGYHTITTAEFRDYIERGRKLPERSVLVTFDDGRTDSFAGADPVLARFGFHATMFTILGDARSGKPFYLTPPEITAMARTGRWDVESHTTNLHEVAVIDSMGRSGHALASRLWNAKQARPESDDEYMARVRADLVEARTGLKSLSGDDVIAFAYPFGDFAQDSEDAAVHAKLPRLVSSLYPIAFREQSEALEETYDYPFDAGQVLRRIYVYDGMSASDLLARLQRGEPKPMPFTDRASFGSPGWAVMSGKLDDVATGRELVSRGDMRDGRAEAFLDGSRWWSDYRLDARFGLTGTETVSVVARRTGPNDYIDATVSSSYTSIEQWVGSKRKLLAERYLQLPAGTDVQHDVRLSVTGPKAILALDGKVVAYTSRIDPSLARGGIGVRVDPPAGCLGRLRLDALTAAPLAPTPFPTATASPEKEGDIVDAR